MDTFNITTPPPQPGPPFTYTKGEVIIFCLIATIVGGIALFINVLIIIAVVKEKRFHTAGFAFLVSLSLTECLALSCRVFLALPTSLAVSLANVVIDPFYLRVIGDLLLIGAYGQIPHILAIAANRFASVVLHTRYRDLFTRRRTGLVIFACWLFTLLWTIPRFTGDYIYSYSPPLLTWRQAPTRLSTLLSLVANAMAALVALISAYLYTHLIFKLRKIRSGTSVGAGTNGQNAHISGPQHAQQKNKERDERRLSIQFSIVTGVYVITVVTAAVLWFALPPSASSLLLKRINLLYNSVWIMNYSINPYVYIISNSSLRDACRRLICAAHISISRREESQSGGTTNRTDGHPTSTSQVLQLTIRSA